MKKIISLILFLITIMSALFFNRGLVTKNVKKGIEFAGGLEVLTKVEDKYGSNIKIADVASIIAKRIDVAGVKNPQIDIETGTDKYGDKVQRIRTTLAGVKKSQVEEVTNMITSQGLITFRDYQDVFLARGTDFLVPGGASLAYQEGQPIVSLKVKDPKKIAEITESLKDRKEGENLMVIWIDFENGVDSYKRYTDAKKIGYCGFRGTKESQRLCAKVISAATVKEKLSGDIIIQGNFTVEEARTLASYINTGSIQYELEVEETNEIEGSFGLGAFQNAVTASQIAVGTVGIFMLIIYGLAGLFSFFSLLIYLFAVLASFNWLGGEYGPDTIAALVIGFGMAADASIILFERFKDELLKGRNISDSFDQSNRKSLSSILDANITTFVVAFILFQFGSRTVKGFAIMLSISIFWTFLIVVLLTRFNLSLLIKSYLFNNKKHWFGVKRKHIPPKFQKEPEYKGIWGKFDFVKPARKIISFSFLVIGSGIALIGFKGTNNSIQFTGGTRISIKTDIEGDNPEEINKVSLAIKEKVNKLYDDKIIDKYLIGTSDDKKYTLTFKTSKKIDDKWNEAKEELNKEYKDYNFTSSTISSEVANDTVKNAIYSLAWSFLAIVGYVTVRFKWSYAIAAIAALLHDALLVWAFFAIFNIEISITFVSAILAIIGYSINDTIVSFDRIREEMKNENINTTNRSTLNKVVNKSIRNTATRSMFTTITTLLAVCSLLIWGPRTSIAFNIAMLVGLIAGTYSSIWIASQIWIVLENFRIKRIIGQKTKKPIDLNEPDENIFQGVND